MAENLVGPPVDHDALALRSIANSIEPLFREAAATLRGIANRPQPKPVAGMNICVTDGSLVVDAAISQVVGTSPDGETLNLLAASIRLS